MADSFILGWLAATALFAMRRRPVASTSLRSAINDALRHYCGKTVTAASL